MRFGGGYSACGVAGKAAFSGRFNTKSMLHTMRWFGPQDPVSLADLRQAGCAGVVTALHQLPVGAVWPVAAIRARQQLIEAGNAARSPLHWAVVESLPVHEAIKKGLPAREAYIANYQQSLRHLAACGVRTVCYNFMPVLDWSRTDLAYELPDGSRALRFAWQDFAVFDLCILKRPGAEKDYAPAVAAAARQQFAGMSAAAAARLASTTLRGLPGAEETFALATFQAYLREYDAVDAAALRDHLHYFIRAVAPVAQELGIGLGIHPDDPPFPLLGLPRVVSTEADLAGLLAACDVPANGLTFCTGSLGVRPDNDLAGMAARFGPRIHFVHLRATRREENPRSFHEADHLAGDVDMYAVVRALVQEEARRAAAGSPAPPLPLRPDHGHQMLDDLPKDTQPGYSAIGRLRGLAELRGLEYGVRRALAEGPPAGSG